MKIKGTPERDIRLNIQAVNVRYNTDIVPTFGKKVGNFLSVKLRLGYELKKKPSDCSTHLTP